MLRTLFQKDDEEYIDKDYMKRKIDDFNRPSRYKLYDEMSINFPILFVILAIFFLLFLLNSYTTMVADDFNNLFTKSGERISSIGDIMTIQKTRYNTYTGRVIANFMGQFMLMFDKSFINFFNSGMFCLFIFSIYRFSVLPDTYGVDGDSEYIKRVVANNRYGRHVFKTGILVMVFFLIWNYTPAFGQSFLWVSGSANYMWSGLFVLSSLHISRRIAIIGDLSRIYILLPLVLILSFLAGWTNENMVVGLIVILTYEILKMFMDKSKGLGVLIMMWISSLVGFIIMVTAPGNSARMRMISESGGIMRFSNMSGLFSKYMLVIFVICLIFIALARLSDTKKNLENEVYLFAGLVTYWSMSLFPIVPIRAISVTIMFFSISIVMSISTIDRRDNKLAAMIIGFVLLYGIYGFLNTVPDAMKYNSEYLSKYNARELIILDNKSSGRVQNVEVPSLPAKNRYMAGFDLEDCSKDPKNWVNVSIARYYSIGSVVLRK